MWIHHNWLQYSCSITGCKLNKRKSISFFGLKMCWVCLSLIDFGPTSKVWESFLPEQVSSFPFPFPPDSWWSHLATILLPLRAHSPWFLVDREFQLNKPCFISMQEPRQCVDSSNRHEKRYREGALGNLSKGNWDLPLLSLSPSSSEMRVWVHPRSAGAMNTGKHGPLMMAGNPYSCLGSPLSSLRNVSLSVSLFLWAFLFFMSNFHTVGQTIVF